MSRLLKTKALVLQTRPLGERDRLLTLYTMASGKLPAVAPGARKVKSKLAAASGPFTCAAYLLYLGRTMATVTQAEIETGFWGIRNDVHRYAYGTYFAELVDKTVEEEEASPELFALLFHGWRELENKRADIELLARCFELKLLSLLGYRPGLEGCAACGENRGKLFYGSASGGLFCSSCGGGGASFALTAGSCALARRLLSLPYKNASALRAHAFQKAELENFLQHCLQHWAGVGGLKSLSFLQKVGGADSCNKPKRQI